MVGGTNIVAAVIAVVSSGKAATVVVVIVVVVVSSQWSIGKVHPYFLQHSHIFKGSTPTGYGFAVTQITTSPPRTG